MRHLLICGGLAVLAGLTACKEKPAEVTVTETRELNTSDEPPKLRATSDQRFGRPGGGSEAGGGSYTFVKPAGWVQRPGTEFRLLNFVAGEKEDVEVYLSESRGGLVGNIARWYRQFGNPEPSEPDLAKLPRLVILGGEGILVETAGTYSPGMGRPASEGFALAGVIGQTPAGILTVKMTGPEAAVKGEMERFRAFCGSLKEGE